MMLTEIIIFIVALVAWAVIDNKYDPNKKENVEAALKREREHPNQTRATNLLLIIIIIIAIIFIFVDFNGSSPSKSNTNKYNWVTNSDGSRTWYTEGNDHIVRID